jgi:short-subunit dehydrogenase
VKHYRSVLVTGATSGIGRALALVFAGPGVHLILVGRDAARLDAVAALARARGATVNAAQVDVRDRAAMAAFITQADAATPIDLAIANAGITSGLAPDEFRETPEAVRAVLATNLVGVFNTVEPCIEPMAARGIGQIAFIGSIGAIRPLSSAPAYSAMKAGVHAYAEALRGRLEPRGVGVSLAIVGFVKTPLNDSISAPKPFEVSGERAAAIIRRGLERNRATIGFPWPLYTIARLSRLLPPRLVDRVMNAVAVRVPQTRERAEP